MVSTLFGGLASTLAVLIISMVVFAFVWDMWLEDDLESAARRTSSRSKGLVTGGGAVAIGAIAPWAEILWQLPEIAIAIFGSIAILQGFSVPAFLAGSLVIYVVAEILNGGPRSA